MIFTVQFRALPEIVQRYDVYPFDQPSATVVEDYCDDDEDRMTCNDCGHECQRGQLRIRGAT